MLIQISEPGQNQEVEQHGATVGIDLGTTNSLVAITHQGIHEVIQDENGHDMLPSVLSKTEGDWLVGREALEANNAIHSIKRLMGKGIDDVDQGEHYPYPIEQVTGSQAVCLNVDGEQVTPVELSAEILKKLKSIAENELENIVDKAVITVPAYFDEASRQATKDAAELAGLEVLRLINEPTAAALAYGLDKKAQGTYAIYDFGGGTFDVTIIKMDQGVFKVIAAGGDAMLGGDDFDRAIAEFFKEEFFAGMALSQQDHAALIQVAKKAKEELTQRADGSWPVMIADKEMQVALDKAGLEHIIAPIVKRTINASQKALFDAELEVDEINGVVMVGGSTRVPLVVQEVKTFFEKEPLVDLDPDRVVAIGAAIQAETLSKGSGSVLIDVTPLSLGLETMGGMMEVVIPRNSPIPIAKEQQFTTYEDGQTMMKIHALQGEREMVDKCRSLAQFTLSDIPPMKAGMAVIKVQFVLDADGLLTINAEETTTGKKQVVEVKPSYGLSREQLETMLSDSMENAQADITERLLAESKLEADQSIRTIEDALQNDGHLIEAKYKQQIVDAIDALKRHLQGDNRDVIDYEVSKLNELCNEFAEIRMNKTIGESLSGKQVNEVEKMVSE